MPITLQPVLFFSQLLTWNSVFYLNITYTSIWPFSSLLADLPPHFLSWQARSHFRVAYYFAHSCYTADDNNIFPIRQSSYFRGHSTETVMLWVYNDLTWAVDSQLITTLVLLYLSSVFETVDQSTSLTVLDRHPRVCNELVCILLIRPNSDLLC